MEKPLCIFFSDIHLDKDNYQYVEELCEEVFEYAYNNDISFVFLLGDVLKDRPSQSLQVLMSFLRICKIAKNYRIYSVAKIIRILIFNTESQDYFHFLL